MAVKKTVESFEVIRARVCATIAMDLELDGVDLRVFLYLNSRLGFDTFTHVPQIELATMLGRRKEHISRSIRALIAAGVLVPGDRGPRASEWRLNPDYGN